MLNKEAEVRNIFETPNGQVIGRLLKEAGYIKEYGFFVNHNLKTTITVSRIEEIIKGVALSELERERKRNEKLLGLLEMEVKSRTEPDYRDQAWNEFISLYNLQPQQP